MRVARSDERRLCLLSSWQIINIHYNSLHSIDYFIITVIKGKVLLIDEQNSMLEYVVEVVRVIQQGNKDLNVGQRIGLWKRGTCQSPDLKENKEYLFMGKDEGRRYDLDKTSFVKLWPRNDNNKDKRILDDFAGQHAC